MSGIDYDTEVFQPLPTMVSDAISVHLKDMKNFIYCESRIGLLKRAIEFKIPLYTNMLSDLNIKKISDDLHALGPFAEESTPTYDATALKQQLISLESQKVSLSSAMTSSRDFIKKLVNESSYKKIYDFLQRTQNDIKTNVGFVNSNTYDNGTATLKLNNSLNFRWRSFFKDIALGNIEMHEQHHHTSLPLPTTSTASSRLSATTHHTSLPSTSTASSCLPTTTHRFINANQSALTSTFDRFSMHKGFVASSPLNTMAVPLNQRILEESRPCITNELSPCDLDIERNAIQSGEDGQKRKRKRKRNRKSKRSKQTEY